jgi:arginyl-tRNA synthetase
MEEGDLGSAFLTDLVNERVDASYLARLTDPGEMALLRRFADFPRTIESAARSHEPHRIAFYLYELACEFHAQWNRGSENQLLRFVNPGQPELTRARLALVHATRLILSCGLAILGVQAPDEMR